MSAVDFFFGLAIGVGFLVLAVGVILSTPSWLADPAPYSAHVTSPGIIGVTVLRDVTEYNQVILDVDGCTQLFPHYWKGESAEVHLGPGLHRVQVIGVNGAGMLGKHTLVDITTQGRSA